VHIIIQNTDTEPSLSGKRYAVNQSHETQYRGHSSSTCLW